MRKRVTNKFGGPFDIQTSSGPRVIAAYEEIEDDFTDAQIEMMGLSGVLEISDEELPDPVIMKAPEAEPDGDLETLRLLYAEKFGKEPDKRWGAKRIRSEMDGD